MARWNSGITTKVMQLSCRFVPPVPFNDKIFPVCLPEAGDENQLEMGMHCYATGVENVLLHLLETTFNFYANRLGLFIFKSTVMTLSSL